MPSTTAATRVQPCYARSIAVVVYASGSCTYCRILARHLLRAGITFVEVDCDQDEAASELAREFCAGAELPVVVFPDGSALATRLLREIRQRLEELGLLDERGRYPHLPEARRAPLVGASSGARPGPGERSADGRSTDGRSTDEPQGANSGS